MGKKYIYFILILLSLIILYRISSEIDKTKSVHATFSIIENKEIPLNFSVRDKSLDVTLAKLTENTYHFKNTSSDTIYFRPIHHLYPDELAEHYKMLKCFCFDDMILLPYEEEDIEMSFLISAKLNDTIKEVRIEYSLIPRKKEDVLIYED